MKLSEHWLREWVNPQKSAQQIGEQLTMAGLELDDLSAVAKDFSGVVVGQVIHCERHPNADKLTVTQVDVGQASPLQIVCGAPNVAVGIKVPVAMIGAQLPNPNGDAPIHIQAGELRGVSSQGMLCGGSEIDVEDDVDGLLILDADAPIGTDVRHHLGLDNQVLDISITPNRGDCFSVRGLAREVALANDLPFALPFAPTTVSPSNTHQQAICIDSDACPIYLAQYIGNVSGQTPSPAFIKRHLSAIGVKPRNLLVDVTNFVLFELGQPLHAFDADTIKGTICVRTAKAGETLTLLNDETVTMAGDELVICDDAGVIALAGIMGGARTAVTDSTVNVVLESAHFAPLSIAGRARRFGLHTDASQRFERGVDPALPSLALDRAVALICEHSPNASIGKISHHVNQSALPVRKPISVTLAHINGLLGTALDISTCSQILTKLDIANEIQADTIHATAPTHRFDIAHAVDLIEEIGRIYGYNQIDNHLPSFAIAMSDDSEAWQRLALKSTLATLGYLEAVSFSFCDAKIEALLGSSSHFGTDSAPLALSNPISSELAVMRRTLLSSLLPCVQYNLKRQERNVRLFETGLVFLGGDAEQMSKQRAYQPARLAMVATSARHETWHTELNGRCMDFFDLKADVQSVLGDDSDTPLDYVPSTLPFLHPHQSADIIADSAVIGYLGQLHPKVCAALDLPVMWVAELDLDAIIARKNKRPIIDTPSRYPSVRRDFAVLVDRDLTWGQLYAIISYHAGKLAKDITVFDIYHGEHMDATKQSVAFSVTWQDPDGTMTDTDIKTLSDGIVHALSEAFGAELRE